MPSPPPPPPPPSPRSSHLMRCYCIKNKPATRSKTRMEFAFSPFCYKSSIGNRNAEQTSEARLVIPGRRELTDRQLCVCCESWAGVLVDYDVIVHQGHLSWVFGRVLNAGSLLWDPDALRKGSRWHGVLMAQRVRKNLRNKNNTQTWPSTLIY